MKGRNVLTQKETLFFSIVMVCTKKWCWLGQAVVCSFRISQESSRGHFARDEWYPPNWHSRKLFRLKPWRMMKVSEYVTIVGTCHGVMASDGPSNLLLIMLRLATPAYYFFFIFPPFLFSFSFLLFSFKQFVLLYLDWKLQMVIRIS